MQIRDLECKAGLDRSTIRFYEKEGFIVPIRKENGYREYSDDNLKHLLKIKLLRQLGMSLDTIKSIRQGSTDFNQALFAQIRNLENVMQAAARAKDICTELYYANTNYDEFDAVYYLQLLSRQQAKISTRSFREYVERPYHPIRRFLARMTDYAIIRILIEFLLVVVLRVRPYGEFLSGLITYGTPFLMIPIASLMIHKWGTTPGKWIYGISVLSEDGCNLGYSDALEREWRVVAEGYGFGIPIWSIIRLYKSYRVYQEYELDWDQFCEFQFKNWNRALKSIAAASIAIILAMNFIIASDVTKPRFRGEITVSEFAANYNFYYKLTNDQLISEAEMRPDGNWYPEPVGQVTIDTAGKPMYPNQNFVFETDGSHIRSIRYENTWTEVGMLYPVTYQCEIASIAAVMSQKGMGITDVLKFAKLMDSADFLHDGSIEYENVSINWNINTTNCTLLDDLCYITDDESKPSQASVEFEITIDDQ